MRIHSIDLKDFRGVTELSVSFPDAGITIVVGNNEVGKTSLTEAVDLLFEYPDSSGHRRIKAAQPVNRDVGPRVEVEVSSGRYRFTYAKQWCKSKETTLVVHEPAPANFKGKEAHDHVVAMLDETLDWPLWRAFQLRQGTELAQPDLNVGSLARALDVAAGTEADARGDDAADDLWEKVRKEFERYFTATGKPLAARVDAAEKVRASQAHVAEVQDRINALDTDTTRIAALIAQENELRALTQRHDATVDNLSKQHGALEALRQAVERSRSAHDMAQATAQATQTATEARSELVGAFDTTQGEATKRRNELTELAPTRALLDERLETARAAARDAHQHHQDAQAAYALAAGDLQWRKDELDREMLSERSLAYAQAREAVLHADEELRRVSVDDDALARIEAAREAEVIAGAEASAAATTVEATALTSVALSIDDTLVALASGESRNIAVDTESTVVVDALVQFVVRTGHDATELAAKLQAARQHLGDLCQRAHVQDVADARRAHAARTDALRARREANAQMVDKLRDLSPEEMADKLLRLEQSVAEYSTARPTDPQPPADIDAAKSALEVAARRLAELEPARDLATTELNVAQGLSSSHGSDVAVASARLEDAEAALAVAVQKLNDARSATSDETIAQHLTTASKEFERALATYDHARGELSAQDPEGLDARLDAAQSAKARSERELTDLRTELTTLQATLRAAGEAGLAAELDEAITERDHLAQRHESTEARAEAAKLLCDTMDRHRAASHQRYIEPFRLRIEELARIVFGNDVEVTLDDDLSIRSRTLRGVTVPFDQLSTGAREQLGIIARLACASIVSPFGGAPVIFDDALGWTDPDRLDRVAAAIRVASKDSQIIVLTSTASRYAGVGSANVVTI